MAAATQPFSNFPDFFFVSQRTLVKNAAALVASAAQYALNNTPVPSGPEKGLLLAQHAVLLRRGALRLAVRCVLLIVLVGEW